MSERDGRPAAEAVSSEVLARLLARWALEHQDEVDGDDDLMVIRLPKTGVVVLGPRRPSAARYWIDAGRGAIEATLRQVVEALTGELRRHGRLFG